MLSYSGLCSRSLSALKPRNGLLNLRRTMVTAKSVIYSSYGPPTEKIQIHSYNLASPEKSEIILESIAHPINPSDINQIEGVYPSKPELTIEKMKTSEPSAVAGNEGLFKVVEIGPDVKNLQIGDWCIPCFPNYGTWTSHVKGAESDFICIKDHEKIPVDAAATISVNTCTAYELLTTITKLEKGDWFIQNGGNSSVGRYAIQIGKLLGYKSICVVRDRPDIEALKKELTDLGATHVITEEENSSKEFGKTIKGWVGADQVKLALNCVGGKSSSNISRKLSSDGHFVTYGGMSKQPVTFPTSLFIFKNLTAKGYWITRNNFNSLDQKKKVVSTVLDYFRQGLLVSSKFSENSVNWKAPNEEILKFYQEVLEKTKKGKQIVFNSN